jgi:Spy/CpxP family protein refolding chaperone
MKNTLLGLAMVIAISSAVALAQHPRHEDFGRDPRGRRPTRIDFLARRLDLTDSQQQQARTIFSASEEAGKEFRKSLEKAREDLNNTVKTGATDQQIEKLAGAVGTLVGQLAANETKARAKFRAILTTEQRQRFDEFPVPGPGMMMRGFGDGRPPGPGMGMMPGSAGGPPPGPHGWNPPPPGPPPSSEDAPD